MGMSVRLKASVNNGFVSSRRWDESSRAGRDVCGGGVLRRPEEAAYECRGDVSSRGY